MEDILDTFGKGLNTVFKNPILFAPYVLLFLFTVVSMVALYFVFYIGDDIFTANLSYVGAAYLIFAVVLMLVSYYIQAGSTGMAKEATTTGKTISADFFRYGNKFVLRMIFSSIIMFVFYLVMVIFWIPAILVFMNSGYTVANVFDGFFNILDAQFDVSAFVLPILIGLLLTFIYSVILMVLFYFVTYAIVVDDISVISAYKKSYTVLKQNLWKVLAFIVLVWLITMVITSIFQSVSFLGTMISLPLMYLSVWLGTIVNLIFTAVTMLGIFVLSAFVSVWTTRFYMSVTEQLPDSEKGEE